MRFVIAIVILCIVILIHELGHFVAAKACKVKVNEFAFGMGPRLFSFKKGETVYAWRAFPIGGMCAMQGEDEDDFSQGSFQGAKVWKRMIIVAAGPVMNFLLALIIALIVILLAGADVCTVVQVNEGSPAAEAGLQEGDIIVEYEGSSISNARELYMYTYLDGLPEDSIDLTVIRDGERIELSFALEVTETYMLGFSYEDNGGAVEIIQLVEGYPMDEAGLQVGDVITAIDGVEVASAEELQIYLSENPLDGSEVEVEYERDGETFTVFLAPEVSYSESGGFAYNMAREKQGIFSSVSYAFGEVKYWINATVKSLSGLFSGQFGVQDLSGPVGIVSTISEVYEEAASVSVFSAVVSMMNMLILISANLGVVNLLPLPALDGGRLVFLIIEAIRRKRCSQTIEGAVHFVGIIAILGLAAYIAFNDVIKLI